MQFEQATLRHMENNRRKTSQFRGVHWCASKNLWRAEIEIRGVAYKLGRFAIEADAAHAYDQACVAHGVPERCNQWWSYTVDMPQPVRRNRVKTHMRRARA